MIPFSATSKQGREEIYEIIDAVVEEASGITEAQKQPGEGCFI